MGRVCVFSVGIKSFEVVELSSNWYEMVERRRNFMNKITFDRLNILSLCKNMELASKGQGNICKSWRYQSQLYSYEIFQNFNKIGRFFRVVVTKGSRKVSVIILKIDENIGGGLLPEKSEDLYQMEKAKASNHLPETGIKIIPGSSN